MWFPPAFPQANGLCLSYGHLLKLNIRDLRGGLLLRRESHPGAGLLMSFLSNYIREGLQEDITSNTLPRKVFFFIHLFLVVHLGNHMTDYVGYWTVRREK